VTPSRTFGRLLEPPEAAAVEHQRLRVVRMVSSAQSQQHDRMVTGFDLAVVVSNCQPVRAAVKSGQPMRAGSMAIRSGRRG